MNIKWKEVTWYSQIAAIIIFVGIFCLGFFLGEKYESSLSLVTMSKWSAPTNSVVGSAGFFCDGGKSIRAVFMTDGAEITLSDGRTMNLTQAVSADGGRYANSDESFVFGTKGNGAFVTENATTTYANCIVDTTK
jgi:membrane-bound inhibitor of C-type lysozyme